MLRWTGLAPWEFEFIFSGSLTSTFVAEKWNLEGGRPDAGVNIFPAFRKVLRWAIESDAADCRKHFVHPYSKSPVLLVSDPPSSSHNAILTPRNPQIEF